MGGASGQEARGGKRGEPADQGKPFRDPLALNLSSPRSNRANQVQALGRRKSRPLPGLGEGQPVLGTPRGHLSVEACARERQGRRACRRGSTSPRAPSGRRERKTRPPLHFHSHLRPSQSPESLCWIQQELFMLSCATTQIHKIND